MGDKFLQNTYQIFIVFVPYNYNPLQKETEYQYFR